MLINNDKHPYSLLLFVFMLLQRWQNDLEPFTFLAGKIKFRLKKVYFIKKYKD